MAKKTGSVLWFADVGKDDMPIVGGKGSNLGEMVHAGFPVPNGFIISSHAYFRFIKDNNLATKIKHVLATVQYERPESLLQASSHIRKFIMQGQIADDLVQEVFASYKTLSGVFTDALVAIRSSATTGDSPSASLSIQQETYLNVQGESNVVLKMKEAWASLFEPQAIFSRHEKHTNHFRVGIAVIVQKMVASQKSGIILTMDPITHDKSKIIIEAIYGLDEYIRQGNVTPDYYEVAKHDMLIVKKQKMLQTTMLTKVGTKNKEGKVSEKEGTKQKITDKQILALAELGKKLEHHYYFPQEIEWAIEKDTISIVQTRPVSTTKLTKDVNTQSTIDNSPKEVLAQGTPAFPGITAGPIKVIHSLKDIAHVEAKDIIVIRQINPEYIPAIQKASALLAEQGGRTSHAAIMARELSIPAIVGIENITKKVKTGQIVTVNGTKGEVYTGGFQSQSSSPTHTVIKTATKVYVDLTHPESVETVTQDVDGIGLLRAESMLTNIGTHPKKLIHDGKKDVFVKKLAEQIEVFLKAVHPRPVVYRAIDLKTYEYRKLIGGTQYEPIEKNPLLGYHGAFRYIHDAEVFRLEIEAIKLLRNKANLKNIWLMIPFVRTVRELMQVKRMLASEGLHRSPTFKLWLMAQIPANVILLDSFIEAGIDGVSIGADDLTMLLMGTDKDNTEVASEYNELNESALWAFEKVIRTAHKHKITSSICGQAPSHHPDLVQKLVSWGITSITVSPDVIDATRKVIARTERKLIM